jgi:putative nucleotidyltransferase with HDIG domain
MAPFLPYNAGDERRGKVRLHALCKRLWAPAVDLAFVGFTGFLLVSRPGTLLYHSILTLLLLGAVWISYRQGFLNGILRASLAGTVLMAQALAGSENDLEQAAASAAFMVTAGLAGALADRERRDLDQLKRTSRALVRSRRQLEDSYFDALQTLSAALDARDRYTAGHSERVAEYAAEIARVLGVTGEELESIRRAARLHDIGKIGIRDSILFNRGELSYPDAKEMQRHPRIGAELLATLGYLETTLPLIAHHHEHFDGTGYPDGISGERIPLGARIIAVADAFDAMTTDRPYQRALSPENARRVLRERSGSQFDPRVVEAFLDLHESWKHRRAVPGWGVSAAKHSAGATSWESRAV